MTCNHPVTVLDRTCLCEFNGERCNVDGAFIVVEYPNANLKNGEPQSQVMCVPCFVEHLRLHEIEKV